MLLQNNDQMLLQKQQNSYSKIAEFLEKNPFIYYGNSRGDAKKSIGNPKYETEHCKN